MLITLDRGIGYEQNPPALLLAIIQLQSKSSKLVALMPHVPAVLAALTILRPRTLVKVP